MTFYVRAQEVSLLGGSRKGVLRHFYVWDFSTWAGEGLCLIGKLRKSR